MFPNKKNKALTFGFDDCESYDRQLADMFRKYQLKSTFFLISDQLGRQYPHFRYGSETIVERVCNKEIRHTYRGMEVASHTRTHRAPFGELDTAVKESMQYLSTLCDNEVIGMAYPGGIYTEKHIQELRSLGVLYARTVNITKDFKLPTELLAWHPTCQYYNENIDELTDRFLEDSQDDKLFYIYGHSYELENPDLRYGWERFEELCRRLSGRSDIWYATNGEIAKYILNDRGYYGK